MHGVELNAVLAGAHRPAAAIDRVIELQAFLHVAAIAVDHRAADAAVVRDLGQDIAPDGLVLTAAIVDDDDLFLLVAKIDSVGLIDGIKDRLAFVIGTDDDGKFHGNLPRVLNLLLKKSSKACNI